MNLLYRSTSTKFKCAELVVGRDTIICVLTDKVAKRENTLICYTIKHAERIIEQFLWPRKCLQNQ